MKSMNMRTKARIATLAFALLALFGCTRGCSKPPELTADGKLAGKLEELPGHKVVGEFLIGHYEGPPVALYGPFTMGKRTQRFRVLNKIYQAIDAAKVSVELESPSGKTQKEACTVVFEREGIYAVTCDYNEAGEWFSTLSVEHGGPKGQMTHKIRIYEPAR
jgi:hypothetical protein